jgi:DtxR family Mn-dependent transcriptional regulator
MAVHALEGLVDRPVGSRDLAAAVRVTVPSAVKMGKRLAALGLAERTPRRGLRLTPAGRVVARSALRRQRVLEAYLIERLGSPIARVEEEAGRLRHVVSEEIIERMWVALGRPVRDPRGADPIPVAGAADAPERPGE